ncbi:MAG: ABC transporter permease subunit [Nitrososphaerota archaeon]|nr:ABC transporter permease subunit [Nitrososphaerota archaeon]
MSMPRGLRDVVDAVLHSKTGVVGLSILIAIIVLSILAIIYVPFDIAREWNNPSFWQRNPRLASPSWTNIFVGGKLPETMILSNDSFRKYSYYLETIGLKYCILETEFQYLYEDFPSELRLSLYVDTDGAFITVRWIQPNGIDITIWRGLFKRGLNTIYISRQLDVREYIRDSLKRLNLTAPSVVNPEVILFTDNSVTHSELTPVNGGYRVRVEAVSSDLYADIEAELIVYGKVYGLVGTDNNRRDLFVGLVWGAPIALAFGLIAAIATSFIQTLIGSLSAWYGRLVDEVIQRITDIYMIIPFLPILITISVIYRIDIWTLLIVVVGLSLFGGATKTARSMTFQIMTEQYIEAAASYGASRKRILFLYILPRLMPYTMANIVLSVPGYVFLEAALSVLGLGDPMMPTWGKIISDAYSGGAVVHGLWWWILLPSALIILTAISFAFIGLALDKVVNPRLRER